MLRVYVTYLESIDAYSGLQSVLEVSEAQEQSHVGNGGFLGHGWLDLLE